MAFSPVRHFNQEDFSIADILKEKGKHVLFNYDFGDVDFDPDQLDLDACADAADSLNK